MKTNKLTTKNYDPTPYQQWKSEGKSTTSYMKMVVTILFAIPAFVYVASSLGGPFMESIYTGPLVTVAIVYGFWQLLKVFDARF